MEQGFARQAPTDAVVVELVVVHVFFNLGYGHRGAHGHVLEDGAKLVEIEAQLVFVAVESCPEQLLSGSSTLHIFSIIAIGSWLGAASLVQLVDHGPHSARRLLVVNDAGLGSAQMVQVRALLGLAVFGALPSVNKMRFIVV